MEMKEKLKNIVADVIEVDQLEDNDRFVEDYGVDSMMVLELVASIEKEFSITIPEDYYPRFNTFLEVFEVVNELSKERV